MYYGYGNDWMNLLETRRYSILIEHEHTYTPHTHTHNVGCGIPFALSTRYLIHSDEKRNGFWKDGRKKLCIFFCSPHFVSNVLQFYKLAFLSRHSCYLTYCYEDNYYVEMCVRGFSFDKSKSLLLLSLYNFGHFVINIQLNIEWWHNITQTMLHKTIARIRI